MSSQDKTKPKEIKRWFDVNATINNDSRNKRIVQLALTETKF
jgi:hypothetical protein